MIEGAQYVDGKVALRYYSPIPKLVQIGPNKYVTDVRHGVSMLLLDEAEVPGALSVVGGCCGGKRKVFSLASKEAVSVWQTGNRN